MGIVMSDEKLTEQQMLFVKEYIVDFNGTQAAIRAGYSEKTAAEQASRLLKNVKVAKAVAKEVAERAKRVEVNADYVLATIVETVERCKQEVEPIYEGHGKDREFTGEFAFNAGAVLKGAELLGKHLKMFTDKVEHSGEMEVKLAQRLQSATGSMKDSEQIESTD
jgi:phage terminase small subunit